ncbi:unnamed protein product [Prorocentrum cordatum]|uniref:Uncharacterized protein n=1 Tax=Prorocentrum cordatum TaxID=2364126 RepID=A0ABN9UVU0_9DINO|nr:unnamed protein product [Polarella glacialis]
MDKTVAARRTDLSKETGATSKKERICQSEVENRLATVLRRREALEQAQRAHVESVEQLTEAKARSAEALATKDGFNDGACRAALREKERAEAAAAARAAAKAGWRPRLAERVRRAAASTGVGSRSTSTRSLKALLLSTWREMRKVAIQQRAEMETEAEMASDAGGGPGDRHPPEGELGELRELRKRAAKAGLDGPASVRYGEFVSKQPMQRATKKARRIVQHQSSHTFVAFCQAAVVQLGAIPEAPASGAVQAPQQHV